jgi:uncharacterized membrane protein YkoI
MNARRTALLLAALTALVLAAPVSARADGDRRGDDRDHDHDLARELYEHGEISALQDVLRELHSRVAGEVVSVDLVQVGEKWVYRFQVVAKDGQRSMVDVDASAGTGRPPAGSEP